jgi:hypothetical protein
MFFNNSYAFKHLKAGFTKTWGVQSLLPGASSRNGRRASPYRVCVSSPTPSDASSRAARHKYIGTESSHCAVPFKDKNTNKTGKRFNISGKKANYRRQMLDIPSKSFDISSNSDLK